MHHRQLSRPLSTRPDHGRFLTALGILACACLLLANGPAAAQSTFPIETTLDVGDLQVTAEATSGGPMVVVSLNNRDTRPARCLVVLRNGPETRRRRTDLPAGERRDVSQSLRREVVRLRITVTCEPG